VDKRRVGQILEVLCGIFLTPVGLGFSIERGQCARLRLYWYNGQYSIHLLRTYTCSCPSVTLSAVPNATAHPSRRPRIDSSLSPGASAYTKKELFQTILMHMMTREIIPGRMTEGSTWSSINCDRSSLI